MHAVRWTGPGASTKLYPFGNGSSAGYGINDSGVVSGSAYIYSFVYFNYFTNGIRWTGGSTVDELARTAMASMPRGRSQGEAVGMRFGGPV